MGAAAGIDALRSRVVDSGIEHLCSGRRSRRRIAKPAATLLNRIHEAAQQQNYEGTFVYQRGATVQSSRITHVATRGDGEYESLESLDGAPRKMLRHDDDMFTFVPERHLLRRRASAEPGFVPGAACDERRSGAVRLRAEASGQRPRRGHREPGLELDPKDSYRFAYKLWADAKTGLLLRAQTLDPDGQVLEQLSFSQVRIGGPIDKAPIANGIRSTSGWTIVRPPVQPVDMEAQGWQLTPNIAGFRKIRELRRPMASSQQGQPPIPVDQAVFSDGLATISVFVEPVEKNTRKEGAGNSGATHVLVKRRGDFWITLLGEVPQATLQQFASTIEYKPSK